MHLGTSREQTVSPLGIFGSQECNIYYFQLLNAPFFIYHYSQSTFSLTYLFIVKTGIFIFYCDKEKTMQEKKCSSCLYIHKFMPSKSAKRFFFLFAKAELTRRILLIILRSDHSNKCRAYVFLASDFLYYDELIS
jgi:hypothetical protein